MYRPRLDLRRSLTRKIPLAGVEINYHGASGKVPRKKLLDQAGQPKNPLVLVTPTLELSSRARDQKGSMLARSSPKEKRLRPRAPSQANTLAMNDPVSYLLTSLTGTREEDRRRIANHRVAYLQNTLQQRDLGHSRPQKGQGSPHRVFLRYDRPRRSHRGL